MSNKLRARNRLPFNFADGLRVNGQLLSGPLGAAQIGISSSLGSGVTNLQQAIESLKSLMNNSQTQGVAFTGIPTVPTAPAGDSSNAIANTAFITNAVTQISILPVLSNITISSVTTTGATFTASITNTRGYNPVGLTAQFQIAPQFNSTAYTNVGIAQAFVNISTPFTVNATGLLNNTAYFVRVFVLDSNTPSFRLEATLGQFTTGVNIVSGPGGGAGIIDADSSFDIVGATYTTTNVNATNAVVSNSAMNATATADNAFATSIEIAQQSGQVNFTSITPTISFRPVRLNISSGSTTTALNLSSNNTVLNGGDTIYTVEAGTLFKRTVSSITSNGLNTVTGANSNLINNYSFQNINKATTVSDITGWTTPGASLNLLALNNNSAVVTSRGVYILGGFTDTRIQYAPIDSSGVVGSFVIATTTLNLNYGLSRFATAVIKNIIYLIGGMNGTPSITSAITRININSDGTLGTQTLAGSIPLPLQNLQVAITGPYIYVLGGADNSISPSTGIDVANVYYAPINNDGTIGAWTAGTNLPLALSASQVVVTNSRVYLVGGYRNGYTNAVYYAPINANGTLGAWVVATSLPIAIGFSKAVMTKDRVYMVGGYDNPGMLSTVYSAPINASGVIGTWVLLPTGLPTIVSNHNLIVTKSRVYILGFQGNNSTYYAPFADGWEGVNDITTLGISTSYLNRYSSQNLNKSTNLTDITNWTIEQTLSVVQLAPGAGSSVVVTSSRVYIIGGATAGGGNRTRTVVYAPIDANGIVNPASFVQDTSLPEDIGNAQVAVLNGVVANNSRVYLIGGSSLSTVYYAPIDSNGVIGNWNSVGALPAVRSQSNIYISSNRIYLLGGNQAPTFQQSIFSVPINNDGTLGTWIQESTNLPFGKYSSQVIVTRTRLYLVTGRNAAAPDNTIYYAPINSDGSFGTWVLESNTFPINIDQASSVVFSNRAFIFGGSNSVSSYTAPIDANGVLGAWTPITNIPGTYWNRSSFVTSSRIYLLGGTDGTNIYNSLFSAPLADGWNGVNDTKQINYTANFSSVLSAVPTAVYKAGQYSQSSLHLTQNRLVNDYKKQNITKVSTIGNLGAWSTYSTLPTEIGFSQAIVTSTRIYLIGGLVNGASSNKIYYIPVNSNGTLGNGAGGGLGSWVEDTSLPFASSYAQSAVVGNRLYLLGGSPGSGYTNNVYYATIDSNGVLGSTWTRVSDLPGTYSEGQTAVIGNRLYLLGGFLNSGTTSNVYYAIINEDNSLGSWTLDNNTLFGAFNKGQVVVTNSRIYIVGGTAGYLTYAPINSDNSLGTWQSTNSFLITTAFSNQVVVTKDRIYSIGGTNNQNNGQDPSFIQYAPIDSNGVIGTWVQGTNLAYGTSGAQAVVTNGYIYLIGGASNGNQVQYALFPDSWVGINSSRLSFANFVTDTISSEVITGDTITMTGNARAGNGRLAQLRIGMNSGDVSTQLKGTLTNT